jgi:hypothetical protein
MTPPQNRNNTARALELQRSSGNSAASGSIFSTPFSA